MLINNRKLTQLLVGITLVLSKYASSFLNGKIIV